MEPIEVWEEDEQREFIVLNQRLIVHAENELEECRKTLQDLLPPEAPALFRMRAQQATGLTVGKEGGLGTIDFDFGLETISFVIPKEMDVSEEEFNNQVRIIGDIKSTVLSSYGPKVQEANEAYGNVYRTMVDAKYNLFGLTLLTKDLGSPNPLEYVCITTRVREQEPENFNMSMPWAPETDSPDEILRLNLENPSLQRTDTPLEIEEVVSWAYDRFTEIYKDIAARGEHDALYNSRIITLHPDASMLLGDPEQ